jgi:serine/threonine protein kinase
LRGDYLIFDFGLSKELKRKDLVEPPDDGFEATGLTGSRRYMAAEVVSCKNYGFSADVYAFAIFFLGDHVLESSVSQTDVEPSTL